MGTVTVTSAILLITAWTALIEFDSYSEEKRTRIIEKIKITPLYWLIIALLPLGIIVSSTGTMIGSVSLHLVGASLIFIQSLIIAVFLWKESPWKSVMLFILIGLGIFLSILFLIR